MSETASAPNLHSLIEKSRAVGQLVDNLRADLRHSSIQLDATQQELMEARLRADELRLEVEAGRQLASTLHSACDTAKQEAAKANFASEVLAQQLMEVRTSAEQQCARAEASLLAAIARETTTRMQLSLSLLKLLQQQSQFRAVCRANAAATFATRTPRPLRRRNRLRRAADHALVRLGRAGHRSVVRSAIEHPTPLFDAAWYLQQNDDVARTGADPLLHYLLRGSWERRSPHPLFSEERYRSVHAEELSATGVSSLEHYRRRSMASAVSPTPLFDVAHYLLQQIVPEGSDPLSHYLQGGWKAGASPHPLFDPKFYASQAGWLPEDRSPLEHFVTNGWRAGLSPHPLFDVPWYLENYGEPDDDLDPLSSFLMHGAETGHWPSPYFDLPSYVQQRGEAIAPGDNPLVDYLEGGAWALDMVDASTTTLAYIASRDDPDAAMRPPLEHWARLRGRDGAQNLVR